MGIKTFLCLPIIACAFTAVLLAVSMRSAKRKRYQHTKYALSVSAADKLSGPEFEIWCADLLRHLGWKDVQVLGGSGDQGTDILGKYCGKLYAIQCKRYRKPLGNKPVQEINAGMEIHHANYGMVMTNSTFTKGAEEAAILCGKDRPIYLIDRKVLSALCDRVKRGGTWP